MPIEAAHVEDFRGDYDGHAAAATVVDETDQDPSQDELDGADAIVTSEQTDADLELAREVETAAAETDSNVVDSVPCFEVFAHPPSEEEADGSTRDPGKHSPRQSFFCWSLI